jgi:DeoR/GlpR family transcriptional regulator of sugar metabolism
MKRAPVITDLSALPVILTLPELAAIYRVSPLTIRRGLQQNTFRPLPFDKYPYRWLREDVQRDLQTHRAKLKTRRHGFAATKAKRQAAEDRLVTK